MSRHTLLVAFLILAGQAMERRASAAAQEESEVFKAYKRKSNAQIGATWYFKVNSHRAEITDGSVKVQYVIDAGGKASVVEVEPRDGAKELFVRICREAIEETRLDPPPEELLKQSVDALFHADLTFTFYHNQFPLVTIQRQDGQPGAKRVEEYRARILTLFNQRLSKTFKNPPTKSLPQLILSLSINRDGKTKVLEARTVKGEAKGYLDLCRNLVADTPLPPPPEAALELGDGKSYVETLTISPATPAPAAGAAGR